MKKNQTKFMILTFGVMTLGSIVGYHTMDKSVEDLQMRFTFILGAFMMLMTYFFSKN